MPMLGAQWNSSASMPMGWPSTTRQELATLRPMARASFAHTTTTNSSAAEPRHQQLFTLRFETHHCFAKARRHGTQHRVAHGMAEGVVDALEPLRSM